MKIRFLAFWVAFSFIVSLPVSIYAIDTVDTKMLSQPALSANHIAFVYAGDLWIADRDGSNVYRLTSDEGIESDPIFSPDGRLLAFNAQYDGNTDVYIIPVKGGIPKRLTYHPVADSVCDFSPDGSTILFRSQRSVFTRSYSQLFTISIQGGFPLKLQIPNAYKATYSPDGKKMAYTPLGEAFRQWKNYRGGTTSTIWIYTQADHSVDKIPQPEGRCNDTDPMWMGDSIYFRSDRNGEFNLYTYDTTTKNIKQLTSYTDFPILDASLGTGKIIYEQAAYLHVFDPGKGDSQRLKIGVAADLLELRPRYVKGDRFVRDAAISPSGARAVFEFRGEILTVPAEKGDPRNLTNTTGIHERSPIWSPDGKSIAYFSDESGEYGVHIQPQDGKGSVKKLKLNGSGFYANPAWSPDSKKITYTDNGRSLYWIDTDTGSILKIATEFHFGVGPFGTVRGVWSHDSQWIAYTLNTEAYFQQVFVYSLAQNKSFVVTDGLSEVAEPVFDKSGKYLYFFASTNAGPVKNWFAMSSADMEMTSSIYLVTLRNDVPSPLAKESDEEKKVEEKPETKGDESQESDMAIDFESLNHHILCLPVPAGNYRNLQAGDEGIIYYLEGQGFGSPTKLHKYNLKERKGDVILPNAMAYWLSHDNKKILHTANLAWGIVSSSAPAKPGEGKLNVAAIQVRIDPVKEWKQIFYEAWRVNRDYFYATNYHGADWEAMQKKYAPFLSDLSCRNDLNRIIRWMCSELGVGHHRVGGGDFIHSPERIPGGLLGANYAIEDGRYKIIKVFGGLNWNPELRSPLTEPGVNVKAGEYILAVNGVDLRSPENLFSRLENTSGKLVEITVGPNPDGTDSRTVTVVPIASEGNLRNRDWVEGNIKKVDAATNGRVAYVYVPNTTNMGHTYFKRYFFPQVHEDAIIVDERFNGGGQVADYYIDILRRPFISYWNMRYNADLKTPNASIQGPKVMLIDETAGSGGDLLPWMFRKLKLGKLIGKRTWGGLVGTLGFPMLMDGGYVTAPNIAIWAEDGWVVENVGVPPDIEVEQWPAEVIQGHDPQLEKAIEVILDELEQNPPKKLKRPPYPVRVKKK